MVIYKLNSNKSMELDKYESITVKSLWVMFDNSFEGIDPEFSIKLQGKKVFLNGTTIIKPVPVANSELRLDI